MSTRKRRRSTNISISTSISMIAKKRTRSLSLFPAPPVAGLFVLLLFQTEKGTKETFSSVFRRIYVTKALSAIKNDKRKKK